jgi:hypothetical protein
VDFYAGSTWLGSDNAAPYSLDWTTPAVGPYALKAMATDNSGATAYSPTRPVTIKANSAPAISLTSPLSGASFTAPASIAMTATATDSDGTVQVVEFYVGTTMVGSDSTSPYSFTWSGAAVGTYSVNAVARDNLGATTASAWKELTVTASVVPGTATFAPAVLTGAIERYVLEMFVAGADVTTTAPVSTIDLGLPPVIDGLCTADVRAAILALAPGSYTATVSAISPTEGTFRSDAFAFTR